jgi:uroporphyrinogen-III synthase
MAKTAFISVEPTRFPKFFQKLKKLGYAVIAEPLIDFESVPFHVNQVFDWVFFSSPRTVHFFFLTVEPNAAKKFKCAALGLGTAKELEKLGISPEFIGEDSDTVIVARKFGEFVQKSSTVLVPHSDISLKKVVNELKCWEQLSVHPKTIYKTILKPIKFEENFDVLFFSSPSNVDTFLQKNQISKAAKVLAIGQATSKTLNQLKILNIEEAALPTDEEIAKLLG